jgi:hypothetical protein
MPNKPKLGSRANSQTPIKMESRKESVELIDAAPAEEVEGEEEEFNETGEMNVRFKVRGLFLRVNIFGDF